MDSSGNSSNESGSGSESGESEDGSESEEEEEEDDEDEKDRKKKKNELKKPVQESERLKMLLCNDVVESSLRMWIHLNYFLLSLIKNKNPSLL